MRYNVAGLLKSPTGDTRTVVVEGRLDLAEPDARIVAPVNGEAWLIREPTGVLAQVRLTARIATACARCLAPMEHELDVEFTESFYPSVYMPGGPQVQIDEDTDPATLIDELHVLDLTEVTRQAVILALPVSPVCRPDCRGLCPTCGADLNEGPCGCERPSDPRWDALRGLLGESSEPGQPA
jgi:uncharacterized protein